MTHPDVCLVAGHEPYTDPRCPVPINATIVHAATLLHPQVPQPDGGMIYRCLTEFPDRLGEVPAGGVRGWLEATGYDAATRERLASTA